MADVSNSGTLPQPEVAAEIAPELVIAGAAGAANASEADARTSKWYRLRQDGAALIKYLLDSEVHTYAFSVAANAILSFIPFVVLLYSLSLDIFHSRTMAGVVTDLVDNYFPSTASAHFKEQLILAVPRHLQALSVVLILISCTGIFLPLEVALNQAWGVEKSRNYLMNQLVAFASPSGWSCSAWLRSRWAQRRRQCLRFSCSTRSITGSTTASAICGSHSAAAQPVSCFSFPFTGCCRNRKVPWRPVLRTSIVTGIIWLVAKYIFAAVLPHMDLRNLYGPFFVSVGLLFWAYISGLILFAGAQFSVARLSAARPGNGAGK